MSFLRKREFYDVYSLCHYVLYLLHGVHLSGDVLHLCSMVLANENVS